MRESKFEESYYSREILYIRIYYRESFLQRRRLIQLLLFSFSPSIMRRDATRFFAGIVHTVVHKRDAASPRQIKINDAFNIWLVRMQ